MGIINGLRSNNNQATSHSVTRQVNPEQQRVLDEYERNRDQRLTERIMGTAQEASTPVGTFEILDVRPPFVLLREAKLIFTAGRGHNGTSQASGSNTTLGAALRGLL